LGGVVHVHIIALTPPARAISRTQSPRRPNKIRVLEAERAGVNKRFIGIVPMILARV